MAVVQSEGMGVADRAKFVTKALADAINGAEYFLLHRLTVEALNEAMLQAQALIQIQHEELLRLALDGAEVDPDILDGFESETVQ
jgi:hypothetical protein